MYALNYQIIAFPVLIWVSMMFLLC